MILTYHVGNDSYRWLNEAIVAAREHADKSLTDVEVIAKLSSNHIVRREYTAFTARPTETVNGKADARA